MPKTMNTCAEMHDLRRIEDNAAEVRKLTGVGGAQAGKHRR
jgi:hypothetical protein